VLEGMIAIDYAVGLFAMLHCQHTRYNSGVLLFVEHQQGQAADVLLCWASCLSKKRH